MIYSSPWGEKKCFWTKGRLQPPPPPSPPLYPPMLDVKIKETFQCNCTCDTKVNHTLDRKWAMPPIAALTSLNNGERVDHWDVWIDVYLPISSIAVLLCLATVAVVCKQKLHMTLVYRLAMYQVPSAIEFSIIWMTLPFSVVFDALLM